MMQASTQELTGRLDENPLLRLEALGQSVWLDFIRRGLLTSGELRQLIDEDGLSGVTANPSIFEKAIAGSHDYDRAVQALALQGKSPLEMYESIAVEDVRHAADLFRPVFERTGGRDGFVSLEVSPRLAHDTGGTIAEARRFWAALDRPNVMIKVPGTREGLPAIRQLTSEGINVNVTLLFGLPRYREVAEAYVAGLEERLAQGQPVATIQSVASFFLSRIDVLIDPLLDKWLRNGNARGHQAGRLRGQVAIASAKVAYQIYQEIFEQGEPFSALRRQGAHTQRLLWASTSTKNPAYPDLKYVEPLIGPDTVNTMPMETIHAFRDHGHPALTVMKDSVPARHTLAQLAEVGIDIDQITQQLEDEGVRKFDVALDKLLQALEQKRSAALASPVDRQVLQLEPLKGVAQDALVRLEKESFAARLWRQDPTLWSTEPGQVDSIVKGLGWLHAPEKEEEILDGLLDFARETREAGFCHVVDLGMGGSTLAPLVFALSLAPGQNGLPLTVLDSTDPETVLRVQRAVPLAQTLFIVASKSGTTSEPLAFARYFYARVKELKGDRAGENFIAITDPHSPLVQLGQELGFRRVFLNYSNIGGRYSALSHFGLLPAALLGADVEEMLGRALRMVHACLSCVPATENPGLVLGSALGALARQGRDKLTFVVPRPLAALGLWLEQLLAESTGKASRGILPVAGEPLGEPSVYGDDRLFVHVRLKGAEDADQDRRMESLRQAGQPVITIWMDDVLDLGQEFFRWEFATATADAFLGINPFDQPNVQESKDNTNRLLAQFGERGRLLEERPTLEEGPLRFYAERPADSASGLLRAFLSQGRPGDYIGIQTFLAETAETHQLLQKLRGRLRDRTRLATTLGYGPRFLHSTGQFHKGGPNSGLFLQLTADDVEDAPVPGEPYSFGVFKRAQALGDLEALRRHGRRAIRVHLGSDVAQGLNALERAFGF